MMIRYFLLSLMLISVLYGCNTRKNVSKKIGTMLFDDNWRFHRGDLEGAELADFDDSGWRTVDLPHDWSIEDLPGTDSPFDPEAINGVSVGFTVGGTSWYRKEIEAPAGIKGKSVYIQFDGIYMNSDLWLNGERLGKYPYGYSSFWYDITDKVKPGEKNEIAVQVKNEGKNSRWYAGSGIYRHVWLRIAEPVHVAQWGTFITTSKVEKDAAAVNVKTKVNNAGAEAAEVILITKIVDASGKEQAKTSSVQSIKAGKYYEFDEHIQVTEPQLWSVSEPNLYTAISEVYIGKKLSDIYETTFGIRSISFDAKKGFQLNGETMKLKGGCVHHDNGPLGAKAYNRAEERKVELLKASGYNAIRCAHNPPSPAFLDACDKLGMLVINEAFDTWREKKNRDDYNVYFDEWWQADIDNMILRDRNHPSIIMWSTGNEIPNRHKPEVAEVSHMLTNRIKELDTTRPVTNGVNGVAPDKDALFASLDVVGYNYARDKYQSEHERVPARVVYASESFPIEAFEYWMDVEDNDYIIGDFVWTAFDHIGEASIGWLGYAQSKDFYPWNLAFVGDIDICGWKRPQSYYRDALWKNGDDVSIFVKSPERTFPEVNPKPTEWSKWYWHDVHPHWTWKGHEGKVLEVKVFSSGDEVELFQDGKSLGKKETNRSTELIARWEVPYNPGILKAVAYRNGQQTSSSELKTVEKASHIRLTADRTRIKADNQDLSYITVELIDENGVRDFHAEDLVKFEIEGPGTIVAVGNAHPKSTESYIQPHRKAWQGRCLVIVKSGYKKGDIKLKARAGGLVPSEVVIKAL